MISHSELRNKIGSESQSKALQKVDQTFNEGIAKALRKALDSPDICSYCGGEIPYDGPHVCRTALGTLIEDEEVEWLDPDDEFMAASLLDSVEAFFKKLEMVQMKKDLRDEFLMIQKQVKDYLIDYLERISEEDKK